MNKTEDKMEKEININGDIYVLKKNMLKKTKKEKELKKEKEPKKEKEEEKIKIFENKLATKLDKQLSKLLTPVEELVAEKDLPKELAIMDAANVCMIVGLSSEANQLLRKYFTEQRDCPNLDYSKMNEFALKSGIKSRYSSNYLVSLFLFFDLFDESPTLMLNGDYPLTIYNKHFKLLLAPRIEEM